LFIPKLILETVVAVEEKLCIGGEFRYAQDVKDTPEIHSFLKSYKKNNSK
jgi:hypothetical protein